jgi:hypothetical protein
VIPEACQDAETRNATAIDLWHCLAEVLSRFMAAVLQIKMAVPIFDGTARLLFCGHPLDLVLVEQGRDVPSREAEPHP